MCTWKWEWEEVFVKRSKGERSSVIEKLQGMGNKDGQGIIEEKQRFYHESFMCKNYFWNCDGEEIGFYRKFLNF